MSQKFHGYELLLLRRLQHDGELRREWNTRLQQMIMDEEYDLGEIPHHLWFLAVTLDRNKERLLNFMRERIKLALKRKLWLLKDTYLSSYINSYQFTELNLDGIFKYGDDNSLPIEIFKCKSVIRLSLKYNYLDKIPPDIGRMTNLQYLALTNNKIQNKSLPYTMTFCTKLTTLLLDNNLLDALPGFLLNMKSLKTVHRHGNHNYFKSTFMWYHTDVNERILGITSTTDFIPREPERLQFWAAKAIISSKRDFFTDDSIAHVLKDYISEHYLLFNVCSNPECGTAKLISQTGYKVITFQNPYLGNTCVPFQHWTCSLLCAQAVEVPARMEQIETARTLDDKYEEYVKECQQQWSTLYGSDQLCQCTDTPTTPLCHCVIC